MERLCKKGCSLEPVLKYLAQQLAPVIFGVKPAMLVGFHCWDKFGSCPKFFSYQKEILDLFGVKAKVMSETEMMTQVYFYREELVQNALDDSLAQRILAEENYCSFELNKALDELSGRFDVKNIPHEIGLFLGYPSKDVYGYISGHEPYEPVRGPWRIFGEDVQSSIDLMKKHDVARNAMNLMIDRYGNISDCMEKLSILRKAA